MHKVVELNGKKYHIGQVSAEAQLDLYQDIGARLLANCTNTLTNEVNVSVLHGILLGDPSKPIKHMSDVLFPKCYEEGKKEPVTINDFQGDINNLALLVCHCLIGNLADFFTYIESQITELKEELEKERAESLL